MDGAIPMTFGWGRGRAALSHARAASWIAVLAALAGACGDDDPKVRIRIDSRAAIPGDVNALRVIATAGRELDGPTCVAVSWDFPLTAPGDLPIHVDLFPGPGFDAWTFVRVEWRRGTVVVGLRELLVAFPASGTEQRDLTLDQACVALACGSDRQCIDGVCRDLDPRNLLDPGLADPSVRCGPED